MKYTILVFFGCMTIAASAQTDMGNAGNFNYSKGQDVYNQKFSKSGSGSQFFVNDWLPGELYLQDGKVLKEKSVRLDLLNNAIFYLDDAGNEMACISKLKGINLVDSPHLSVYKFVHYSEMPKSDREENKGWYQLVLSGNMSLFKKEIKSLTDPGTQRSTLTELSVATENEYYVSLNDRLYNITKLKNFTDFISEKSDKTSAFMKENKIKGRSEEEYVKLVQYFNSL